MRRMLAAIVGVVMAGTAVAPVLAAPLSPEGRWESTTGESRYDIALCGDGTQLCAKLVWLDKKTLNDETQPYLGTYLIENAVPVAENTWRGDVHIFDKTLGGTITVLNKRTIQLDGCFFFVCKSFKLKKLKSN